MFESYFEIILMLTFLSCLLLCYQPVKGSLMTLVLFNFGFRDISLLDVNVGLLSLSCRVVVSDC